MKHALKASTSAYFDFLEAWAGDLPARALDNENNPAIEVAVLVVDMINGFCSQGALSSPRVNGIVPPIVDLLERAHAYGVRDFFLLNDTHDPEAVEFNSFPPHCVRGTSEAEPVPEIKALDFFPQMNVIAKNSIASNLDTLFPDILASRPQLKQFIVVGNCTDLCVYQMAMYLRLSANAGQVAERQVIVPAECVQTYDTDMETAERIGAPPHPGDLLHQVFLHHMQINGVDVVSNVIFE